jgi:hypothetical protein
LGISGMVDVQKENMKKNGFFFAENIPQEESE